MPSEYSIPFSVDDLSKSLQEKEFSDVKAAEELLENPAFQFLDEWGSGLSSMLSPTPLTYALN